jgi:VWFA-related protein
MRNVANKTFLFFPAILVTASLIYPQARRQKESGEMVKLRTELVTFSAFVQNKNSGRLVGGLTKEDFTLYEDGIKQQITHFSQEMPPLSIVFLLNLTSIRGCEQIITQQGMPSLWPPLRAEDEVALMAFNWNTIWLVQDFTKDKRLVADRFVCSEPAVPSLLTRVIASSQRAIYEAVAHLNRASNPPGRRVVIVLTNDLPWWTRRATDDEVKHRDFVASRKDTRSKEEVLGQLLRLGGMVCALLAPNPEHSSELKGAFRSGMEKVNAHPYTKIESWVKGYNPWEYTDMEFYVEGTGGHMRLTDAEHASVHLTEIIDLLYAHYGFGYLPSNQRRNGKFRRIRLSVSPEVERREGGVIIKTRDGYFAPRSDGTHEAAMEGPSAKPKK